MTDFIKRRLRTTVSKELLIDLEDRLRAEAVKAFEMVRDRAGLNRKRARELEGQARFRMMEEGFENVCQLHGGRLLDGGVIPNTELKVFQPFMRFEAEGKGIILGLAAMPEPKVVPQKNLSRQAGVTMNYHLSPRLDLDGSGPRVGDIFVLFLVARSREKAGQFRKWRSASWIRNTKDFCITNSSTSSSAAPPMRPKRAFRRQPQRRPRRFP